MAPLILAAKLQGAEEIPAKVTPQAAATDPILNSLGPELKDQKDQQVQAAAQKDETDDQKTAAHRAAILEQAERTTEYLKALKDAQDITNAAIIDQVRGESSLVQIVAEELNAPFEGPFIGPRTNTIPIWDAAAATQRGN